MAIAERPAADPRARMRGLRDALMREPGLWIGLGLGAIVAYAALADGAIAQPMEARLEAGIAALALDPVAPVGMYFFLLNDTAAAMRIDGDGWHLRPEDPDDAPELVRAFAEDPHLAVDWGIDELPDAAVAREWLDAHAALWRDGEGRHWTVADGSTDRLLGGVNFHRIEPMHKRAEVGFWLAPWARGRGIGSGAVLAACEWAFERWDLHRIEMTTAPDNAAALALARKIGFTREGLLRQRNFERGKHVDIVMLAALRGELRQP